MPRISAIAFAATLWVGCLSTQQLANGQPASQPMSDYVKVSSEQYLIGGQVVGADDTAVSGARISVAGSETVTDAEGKFALQVAGGAQQLSISAEGYAPFAVAVSITQDTELKFNLQPPDTTTVAAEPESSVTESAKQIYDVTDLLQNPHGQAGVPVSLPGLPSETASGGVKAPQYFAPGVAGDHGEPIAQYIQVGEFEFPNNLPANAHGNGYADPNLLVSNAVGFVEADPGAFDVRHGNNAVDLAVAYGLVPHWEPFMQASLDPRDYDFVSGLSPSNPATAAWLGFELAGGNGFLSLPERRRQYKINGEHAFTVGHHTLTFFGAGYLGDSRIPGMVPTDVRIASDTIDPRQSDHTHTEVMVASDTWNLSEHRELTFSGYFRAYGLDLGSNFGDGLIRQSEFRTVAGGNSSYQQRLTSKLSLDAGMDFRRDAPRNSELEHADALGTFHPVTRNDFVISDLAPYVSFSGSFGRFFKYSAGLRRDQVSFANEDLLFRERSYHAQSGVTLPRGTLAFHIPHKSLPTIAFSTGEAFHTNDPRVGLAQARGAPIATSHANQLTVKEDLGGSEFRVALTRVSNSQELAKIDADTGLQENVGRSLIRSLTFSARRRFSFAAFQATLSRAEAKDLLTLQDVPEAPRAIYDFSATSIHLPWRMQASASIEYVGRKPLGDGFVAVPVRKICGAFTRNFNGSLDATFHFVAASGYTGQTLENLQLPGEGFASERLVGVRQTSYAGITVHYNFRRR